MTRTFLVVDDEPDILDAIQRLFRRDYRVLTAHTAAEALDIVEAEDIQVVMTDQRMPRMTGVEFLARLRQTHPDIVRVLLTGYSNIEDVIEAINEGHVYRYISKPWNPAELKLFVAQAFQYYESRRERDDLVQKLQDANEKLELQNAMLSTANDELKMLDRMKSVFMEVVSHELNTPIAVILGYSFLLRREMDDDTRSVALKALEGINSSAGRLKNISTRIFKMLSSEDTRASLSLEWIDVAEFFDDVREQVEPFLVKREQSLKVSVDAEAHELLADREKLSDVMVNLVMNAIKFSRDGQTIEVRVDATAEGDGVRLRVIDQGIGISAEDKSQIFDAFFNTFNSQYHSSGDFEFGKRGIGLGLSVARRFVEMHGGRIGVESTEGDGSIFTVHLPRRPHDTRHLHPASEPAIESSGYRH